MAAGMVRLPLPPLAQPRRQPRVQEAEVLPVVWAQDWAEPSAAPEPEGSQLTVLWGPQALWRLGGSRFRRLRLCR